MVNKKVLTKSKYKLGMCCPRSLWTQVNEPDKVSEFDATTQHRINEGYKVGELAKHLFIGGIEVEGVKFVDVIENTNKLIKKGQPLFEPGFMYEGCYTRCDILNPTKSGKWDVVEVKATTKVKSEHIDDLAFQKMVYEKSGLDIRKYKLMHLDGSFVKNGDTDVKDLFIIEDVTKEVNEAYEGVEENAKALLELINSPTYNSARYGEYCDSPKSCPMPEICWEFLPDNNVFDLYRGNGKAITLFDECDCLGLKDIPDRFRLTPNQQIQVDCAKCNKIHLEEPLIKEFLDSFEYPTYWIDFESFQTVIPMFDGSTPYQQIPFQFSLHIQREPNGKLEHYEFLAKGKEDPREDFIKHIQKWVGDKGSIIVYNQSFEKSVLNKIAEFKPEYKKYIDSLMPRFVDLLVVFRNFWYYNNSQCGSASIKKVLPALVPNKSYEGMGISNGSDASLEYYYSAFEPDKCKDIKNIRKYLLEYCCQDTLAMYDIVEELRKLIK